VEAVSATELGQAEGRVSAAAFLHYFLSQSGLPLPQTERSTAPLATGRTAGGGAADSGAGTDAGAGSGQETGSEKRFAEDDTALALKQRGQQQQREQQQEGAVDWDTYPLPEEGKWQRRVDKKSGRVSAGSLLD
jgi:hypothetical protein